MSYEKTTWATGDVITAEKLNKIEDGIDSRFFVVHIIINGSDVELDSTWNELKAIVTSGGHVMVVKIKDNPFEYTAMPLIGLASDGIRYYADCQAPSEEVVFISDSADGVMRLRPTQ